MRKLLPLLFLVAVVAAPLTAVAVAADGQPSAATVLACKAEYAQLGADAFTAKYGSSEPWGHCYAEHADATPPATTTTATTEPSKATVLACKTEYAQLGADAFAAKYGPEEQWGHCYAAHKDATLPAETPAPDSAEAQCKAELAKLGADAFAAKYGTPESLGKCVSAHNSSKPAETKPATSEPTPAVTEAQAPCLAEKKALGEEAFNAKYGPKEPFGNCVKSQTPKASTLVKACKSTSGKDKTALKSCLTAATKQTVRRR